MKLLICNIGSSSLDRAALQGLRDLPERQRAAQILADYASYARLPLPIISKALRHVQRQPGELVQIVLIASDQGEPPEDDQSLLDIWQTDTALTAQVVARRMADERERWQPVPPERIAVWLIGADGHEPRDPSDYDGVWRFFERRLPELRAAFPDATAYLVVTGGTPAMTTGLLVAGTEVFGAEAEVLYIHPHHPLPATLNTGKRLQAAPLRAALRSNIATYAYDAALRFYGEQRVVITDQLAEGAPDVLAALLDHARCLFNFDMPGARRALEGGVDRHGDGRWRAALMACYAVVDSPGRAQQIAAVYHGAAARYEVGAYADFLTQVVRLQETTLRMLCLERGVEFCTRQGARDDDGALLRHAWLAEHGLSLAGPNSTRDIVAGRGAMLRLLRQLVQQRGEDVRELLAALDRLEELARLRNDLTHVFEGVDKLRLAQAFGGQRAPEAQADAILPHLAQIIALATGRPPGRSPFAAINELLFALLREARG